MEKIAAYSPRSNGKWRKDNYIIDASVYIMMTEDPLMALDIAFY